ncbi:MAG: NADH-quinone oxidoreductase subunit M [Anaerolineae bacterium]|nr:MAG: NADH-quinone oxidoreductase subunit M [Anaerolineae bacterium]MCL4876928.1 NADH-quinone oxidoreductase subunit M [Anaerolineae bacterium]
MLEIGGTEVNLLTILVFLPLIGASIISILPRRSANLARYMALGFSLVVAVMAVVIFIETWNKDLAPGEFAYENQIEWFSLIGSSWHVGVDGISASMILLTALLTPLAVLIAFEHDEHPFAVMALFLFMETGMLGVFAAMDMLVFFLFYELGLVPMYFIIYIWGGENRDYASRKFFIYTMAASLGLLLAIQLIAFVVGDRTGQTLTFDMQTWMDVWPDLSTQSSVLGFSAQTVKWLALLAFAVAFGLKIPIWPFHTWLPDAHTEAPTAGSMLLAGVLLKLGAYGFLRLAIPLFPLEWVQIRTLRILGVEFQAVEVLAAFAMLSIVFGAFTAWAQDDFKRLIAYSSVNHMGFVAMGLAVFAAVYGVQFALSQNQPDLVLDALEHAVKEEDVATYLLPEEIGGRSAESLIETSSTKSVIAYRKLMDIEDGVTVTCGGAEVQASQIITDNVRTCDVSSFPRLEKERHHATVAANGAVLQMFNHGLSAAGMFLLVGALYHKAHTRDLRRFGGLWHLVPVYGAVLVFMSMASLGLPGLNGFVGEYLVVAGSFPVKGFEVYVLISMVGLLITGAYILKGLQKVLHGPVNPEWQHYHEHHHSLEISFRELLAVAPLMILIVITGLYPNWILPVINDSVSAMFAAVIGG